MKLSQNQTKKFSITCLFYLLFFCLFLVDASAQQNQITTKTNQVVKKTLNENGGLADKKDFIKDSPSQSKENSQFIKKYTNHNTDNKKKPENIESDSDKLEEALDDEEDNISKNRLKKKKDETIAEKRLKPFGYNFFAIARQNIHNIEQKILSQKQQSSGSQSSYGEISNKQLGSQKTSIIQQSAISSFVGPMEMVSNSVYSTIPKRYVISPKDVIRLSFWGKLTEFRELILPIDKHGFLTIPKGGKIVVSGMTLYQLQENIQKLLRRSLDKNLEVIVTLERLKSMQISITGEAYRPGNYAVSAATTLFNALYACGGLTEKGSLRNIRLLRNQKTIHVDFYQYLLYGKSHEDFPLQSGDNIFIPRSTHNVSIEGEVHQPGMYELKNGENLKGLLKIAGGIKPSGIYDKIQIQSVSPNKKRIIIDVNLNSESNRQTLTLHDGDIVTVFPVLPDVKNFVYLEGSIERPGKFELKKGMRLSDLFTEINSPAKDVFWERADIIRLNKNSKTTRLLSINLEKALSNDVKHNIELKEFDRVVIYSTVDIQYIPPRIVTITGAIQHPKDYQRHDNMTIQDLLVKAGGLLPDVYHKRADLIRYDFQQKITSIIPVNLAKILDNDLDENIELKDKDFLRVYSKEEVSYTQNHTVNVYGAVQRPGEFLRSKNLDLKTLIFMAGGLKPGYHNIVEIVQSGADNSEQITQKDIERLLQGDESQNVKIKDEDVVMVKMRSEFMEKPLLVNITGQVKYPGMYALKSRYDKISDIVQRAGGFTRLAYEKGAIFKRKREHIPSEEIRRDLAYVNKTIREMNVYEYRRQKARNDYLWATETGEKVKSPVSEISGAAVIASDASDESIAKSLLAPGIAGAAGDVAGGALDAFRALPSVSSPARTIGKEELVPSERIIVDIQNALTRPGSSNNFILQDEDSIFIPQKPSTVSVIGAVMRPTVIAHGKNGISSNSEIMEYINLAGGYQSDADEEKVIVFRMDGSIIPVEALNVLEVGDVVYVPNKPISMEIVTTTDKILDTVKYAVVTLTGYLALIAILAL